MQLKKELTWCPIIPLIGGFPLGCEQSINKKPEYILGYNASKYNDSFYVRYQKNIPYYILDSKEFNLNNIKPVDIVINTSFCSGLSMLNASVGKSNKSRGSDAIQNEWIYTTLRFSLKNLKPQVFIGENAPGLFTNIGEGVRSKIYEIAKEFGYSFSLYKTNTLLHGIPQKRERTFYFLWKSEHAPILPYIKREYTGYKKYIDNYKGELNNTQINENKKYVKSNWAYKYLTKELKISRKTLNNSKHPSILFNFNTNDKIDKYIEYLKKNGAKEERIKTKDKQDIDNALRIALHWKNKYGQGLGVWDATLKPVNPNGYVNAVINKNAHLFLHPNEERTLTKNELAYLMGMPKDFIVDDIPNQVIGQNVPVNTAADIVTFALQFINNELEFSNSNFLMQNNIAKKTIRTIFTKITEKNLF